MNNEKIVYDLSNANGLIASSASMIVSLRERAGKEGTVFNNEADNAAGTLRQISESIDHVLSRLSHIQRRDNEITQEIAGAAARAEEYERAKKDAKTP
jgi:hypothetical protein